MTDELKEKIIKDLAIEITDYGFNDEYGYYDNRLDGTKEIISKYIERLLSEKDKQHKKELAKARKQITIKWIVSKLTKKTLLEMDKCRPNVIYIEESSEISKKDTDFLIKRFGLTKTL